MLDKDKLFIVVYVGVHGFGDQTVSEILGNVARCVKYDDSVNTLIIPTRDSETRVECINPVLLTEKQYKDAEEKINTLKQEVEEKLKTL